MSDIALKHPGVLSSVAFPGLSINGFVNAPNTGIAFVVLKPSEERTKPDLSAGAIVGALNQQFFAQIPESIVAIFAAEPVSKISTVSSRRAWEKGRPYRRWPDSSPASR
jgi:multidrug efflux pump